MSQWIWFYDLVDQKLSPVFAEHHFTKLTGKGYEEDDKKEWGTGIFFASPLDTKIVVDIHIRVSGFYVIRVYGKHLNLKQWLYPNVRSETQDVDVWRGWKCTSQDDIKNAFDEIVAGLQRYLAEQSENQQG